MASKSALPGYARTGWKSEIYLLATGKDGQMASLDDVKKGIRLLFKACRKGWNAGVIACREDDRSRIEIFKATAKWPEQKMLHRDYTRLYQIMVKNNPQMPDTDSEMVSGLSGPFCRRHLCDLSNGRVTDAFERWYSEISDRKTNRDKLNKALRWKRRREGRVARDYCRPRLKSLRDGNSCYLHPGGFRISGNRLFISKVPGGFKIANPFPWSVLEGKIKVSAFEKSSNTFLSSFGVKMGDEIRQETREIKLEGGSISEQAGRFFVSFKLQVPEAWLDRPKTGNQTLGLDLGVSKAAVSGDADSRVVVEHNLPRPWENRRLRLLLKRKEKWDRAQQRRMPKPGMKASKGYRKATSQIQSLNLEMTNIKRDGQHKLTNDLVRRADCLAIEDLNVKGMTGKSEKHASGAKEMRKRILATCFGELGRQLRYKAPFAKAKLVIANPFFPSTQTCSKCNHRLTGDERLQLRDRTFSCPQCGHVQDRDSNASLTLANLARKHAGHMEPGQIIETDKDGNDIVGKEQDNLSSAP